MSTKLRLIIMNFLQYAVWGAYLTSQSRYLADIGMADKIGNFFAIQGIVSIFMPALIGIIADKWIPAQKMLSLSHLIAGISMIAAGFYGMTAGADVQYSTLFALYTLSVAFYMPTISLSNSVAYTALDTAHLDTVKTFPPIRIWGTIGFIVSMWATDLLGFQGNSKQYILCGGLSLILALYSLTLTNCPIDKNQGKKSFAEAFGLKAFTLFKSKKMAIFFIFSMLLGVSLQITNGFASPYLGDFGNITKYAGTFGVEHSNILISLSQISETLCILLIPFFLKRYGIKIVMLISMFAWVLRFGLLGVGNPKELVWCFVLSMIVYGVAFDFFNISGSLYVNENTDTKIRSSAQGLFMLMTNGFGATIGAKGAQIIVNHLVNPYKDDILAKMAGWAHAWYVFAGYALVVAVLFWILFKYKHTPEKKIA
ncbi:MAG: MFS transporter [Bacteroidales bacterium]